VTSLAPTTLVDVSVELFWTRVRFPASPPGDIKAAER
jgi:hypothetical protein